jgi:hypothetical protein
VKHPPGDSAALALGGQAALGAVLGVAWLAVAPRPEARWTGLFWAAELDYGFGAAQDIWFGLLTAGAGALVGVALTMWSGRPRPWRRFGLWVAGSVLGAAACLGTGWALGGSLAAPAVGAAVRAPLTLTSPGLLAAWAFSAALVAMTSLAVRSWFGRTW